MRGQAIRRLRRRQRKVLVAIVGVALVASIPAALAGKGGGVTGSIELMSSGGLALTATSGPSYGQGVAFATTVEGKPAAKSSVYITVVCKQGTTVVYQASGSRDQTFVLADQAGQGLEWDGSDADCSATLIYKVKRGKSYDISWLDVDFFHTNGNA